jgi:Secretion system C-terminal sorting domain
MRQQIFALLVAVVCPLGYLSAQCPTPLIAPGVICCEQQVCPNESFSGFYETTAPEPSTGSEQLMYQWYGLIYDTNFNSILWRPIAGATTKEYTPLTLPTPPPAPNVGYFMRQVRKTGCTEWLISNLMRITLRQPQDCTSATSEVTEVTTPISVFPNPAVDQLTVFNHTEQTARIRVYTLAGQTLQQFELAGATAQIMSVSALPMGIYLVESVFEDGRVSRDKWVKR